MTKKPTYEELEQRVKELGKEAGKCKEIEDALRKSEEKYRTVLEASPDPIVVYDMEGKVIYFNHAFTHVLGWTLEERLGKKMDVFVPDEDWPETRKMIDKVLAGESFFGFETRRHTKEGNIIPVSISGAIYRDQNGNPAGSIINLRDITDLKMAEEALLRERDKLKEALAKIKTLSGMLPICVSCKNIRDDKGYWNQIESYIREHSEAEFSHSMCPECKKRIYGAWL